MIYDLKERLYSRNGFILQIVAVYDIKNIYFTFQSLII